jgi:dihydroorotate dehydrogenase
MWQLPDVATPFLKRLDSETAHRLVIGILSRFPWSVACQRIAPQIGLAAGFDKNGEILEATARMGFGFTEIGTVTPRPQPGNPKPRMWRLDADRALFNCLGFNNDGADAVAQRVARVRPKLPEGFRIGVSVGKNKDTPIADAAQDYVAALRPFRDLVDYVTINVSSPNTEALRSLQLSSALLPLISEVRSESSGWSRKPSVFVKLAPEVSGEGLSELVRSIDPEVDGYCLTNTLAGEWQGRKGGWSGGRLTDLSRSALIQIRPLTQKTVISVGGILDRTEAQIRLTAGASLIQIYSALIFHGPSVISFLK